jgi:hypothetical protein
MPMVTPAGFASVIESLRLAGDPIDHAVTYGLEIDQLNPPTMISLLESVAGAFNSNVMPTMPTQYTHVNTHIEWSVLAPPAPQLVGDRASSAQGGNALGGLIPQNSAYLIRKNTALGGRRHRGRMYLPGVGEASVNDNGVLTQARTEEINPAVGNWLAALRASAAVVDMVLLHASSPLSPTPAPTAVTSLAVQPQIATQRRRLR